MLSFPKVAKNVEPEFNPQQQGLDWKVKANDNNTLVYGSREYDDKNRLLTAHRKTESKERIESRNGQTRSILSPLFNDPNFHNSVDDTISQDNAKSTISLQTSQQSRSMLFFSTSTHQFYMLK